MVVSHSLLAPEDPARPLELEHEVSIVAVLAELPPLALLLGALLNSLDLRDCNLLLIERDNLNFVTDGAPSKPYLAHCMVVMGLELHNFRCPRWLLTVQLNICCKACS